MTMLGGAGWIKVHKRTKAVIMNVNITLQCHHKKNCPLCFTSTLPLQTAQGTSKGSGFNVHACQMGFHTPCMCLCPSNCSNQCVCVRAKYNLVGRGSNYTFRLPLKERGGGRRSWWGGGYKLDQHILHITKPSWQSMLLWGNAKQNKTMPHWVKLQVQQEVEHWKRVKFDTWVKSNHFS